MEEIIVNHIKINVIRKNIQNMHLAVYPPAGRVRIAAPMHINKEAIRVFAVSKLSWITRNQRKFEQQERMTPREYMQRESHYFIGRRYLLNIIEREAPPEVRLRSKTYIDLYIRPDTSIARRHEIMTEWYREALKQQIPELIKRWESILDVDVQSWGVKQMKTKWGSCNIEQKRIWINLELAKKPHRCLEYIVVHEMVHLLERHHNDRFIHYMDAHLPQWRQIKAELNNLPASHATWNY